MKIIDDSRIVDSYSNGGKTQTILLEDNKRLFKIVIHSESYEKQSYGRLMVFDNDNKTSMIKNINPKRDYGIDISYKRNYDNNSFKKIIDDFKKLIKNTSKFLTKPPLDENDYTDTIKSLKSDIEDISEVVKVQEEMIENLQKQLESKDIVISSLKEKPMESTDSKIVIQDNLEERRLLRKYNKELKDLDKSYYKDEINEDDYEDMKQDISIEIYKLEKLLGVSDISDEDREEIEKDMNNSLSFGKFKNINLDNKDENGNFIVKTDYLQWALNDYKYLKKEDRNLIENTLHNRYINNENVLKPQSESNTKLKKLAIQTVLNNEELYNKFEELYHQEWDYQSKEHIPFEEFLNNSYEHFEEEFSELIESIHEEFHDTFMIEDMEKQAEVLLSYSEFKMDFYSQWMEENQTSLMKELKDNEEFDFSSSRDNLPTLSTDSDKEDTQSSTKSTKHKR